MMTLRRFFFFFAMCLAMPATAEPWKRPFLWRIEGKSPSYVLGVMHLEDERFEAMPPILTHALGAAERVVLEWRPDEAGAAALHARMEGTPGHRVRDLLPEALQAKTRGFVEANRWAWESFLDRPLWTAVMLLPTLKWEKHEGTPGGVSLYRHALAHAKPVDELESTEEQVAGYVGMSAAELLAQFEKSLDYLNNGPASGAEFRKLFFSGDEATLTAFFQADQKYWTNALRQELVHRNRRFADRIAALLADGRPRLVVIGVGHLVGPDNVLARLRRRGLKITRVEPN